MDEEIAQVEAIYTLITELIVNYSFQFLGALIILLIGFVVANRVSRLVLRVCERRELDVTLASFLANVAKIVVVAMVAVVALGKIGISIGPFVAAVGALALGAGLAVQGLLANYGAGLSIIVLRPFVIGDTISVQGVTGVVETVGLSMTSLVDQDGVDIRIPNRHIIGEILHNSHAFSMIELTVGIEYGSEPEAAIDCIRAALEAVEEIPSEPAPLVGIDNFGDSAIELGIRFSAPTKHLFRIRYKANGAVHAALRAAEIGIPFPQRDVHLIREA